MPKPDLEVPTPTDCIGYGAVIVPALDEYQGFFIRDNDTIQPHATTAMMTAMVSGAHPVGALQAVIVEGVLNKNFGLVGAAALALVGFTKMKFFVILGNKEPEGTRTEMRSLKARTIEEARAEIESMPEVEKLKHNLIDGMRKKNH